MNPAHRCSRVRQRDPDPHASVDALKLDAALAAAVREGNARRFLGLAA